MNSPRAHRLTIRALLGALIIAFLPASLLAQELPVDLELVIAVDVSASIDGSEVNLQRVGYMQALADPGVVSAMISGPFGRTAVTYIEWAEFQRVLIDWTLIDSPAAAAAFVATLGARPHIRGETTVISGALDFAAGRFDDNGFEGTRRVIDLSSDGRDTFDPLNQNVPAARDRAVAGRITINGLPINPDDEQLVVEGAPDNLDGYFREFVIGGPGAFTVVAEGANDFPRAILKKLVLEISDAGGKASVASLDTHAELGAPRAE